MDKEIEEMFRKKNREILIQNLLLDLERNIDVLKNSLSNIFDLNFTIVSKNLSTMLDNFVSFKDIDKIMIPLKSKSFVLIVKKLEHKQAQLEERIKNLEFEEKSLDDYYDFVFKTTEGVLNIFKENEFLILFNNAVLDLYKVLNLESDDSISIIKTRISDFIHIRLYNKIYEKVKSELFIRDNNLANKGRESYLRFQDLEFKTRSN